MTSYQYGFAATEDPISDGSKWSLMGTWARLQSTGGTCRAAFTSLSAMKVATSIAIGGAQYAQALVTFSGSGGREAGVCARVSATDGDCYNLDVDISGNAIELFRCADTGTLAFTQLGATFTPTPVSGHTYRITASGSTIDCLDNGVSMGTRTDSTYTTGQPGIWISAPGGLGFVLVDDFNGGDLAGQDTPELRGRSSGLRGERQMQQVLAQ